MTLTRRDLSKRALGTALGLYALPAAAFFHNRMTPETIAERLASDMNDTLNRECEARFSVTTVTLQDVPFWTIDAAIQMDWPPGMRRRPFIGIAADADEAYETVLAEARAYFGEVLAPGDGAGCFG